MYSVTLNIILPLIRPSTIPRNTTKQKEIDKAVNLKFEKININEKKKNKNINKPKLP